MRFSQARRRDDRIRSAGFAVRGDRLFERREALRSALDRNGQRIRTEGAPEPEGVPLRACHRDGSLADGPCVVRTTQQIQAIDFPPERPTHVGLPIGVFIERGRADRGVVRIFELAELKIGVA